MSSKSDLLAELRRHNLMRSLQQKRVIAEAVREEQITSEEVEEARKKFIDSNGLENKNDLDAFLQSHGLSNDDLEWQISLPILIDKFCKRNYRHKAETHFLSRKDELDQVTYSLIRTKDAMLAQELYLRIEGKEANFADLASKYSEGPERNTNGIVGPAPLTRAHPVLAAVLRVVEPGELRHPLQVDDWWLVVRLESYTHATFDENMATRLSRELFDKWINEELTLKMTRLTEQSIAKDAE